MLRTRLIAGMILGPLGLFLVFMGGWWFYITVNIILGLAVIEYARLMRQHGADLPTIGFMIGLVALLAVRFFEFFPVELVYVGVWIFSVGWALWRVQAAKGRSVSAEWGLFLAGFFLIAFAGQYTLMIRQLPGGREWMLITVTIIWSSDVFAYFAGSALGRRQLAPKISPKKTIEGYLGGILGTVLFIILVRLVTFASLPWLSLIVLTIVLSTVVPIGDLMISLLKREANLKDSGSIIPGHGGVLDRFDTMFVGAPLAYVFIVYVVPWLA